MRMIKKNVERIAADDGQVLKLKREGFKELASVQEVTGDIDEQNLEGMTAAELKKLAKEKSLEGCSGLSREELLSVLKGVV